MKNKDKCIILEETLQNSSRSVSFHNYGKTAVDIAREFIGLPLLGRIETARVNETFVPNSTPEPIEIYDPFGF